MMNVSGTLNIENSTITGNRQGVIARAGDVNIVNSEITVTGAWAEQSGNDADKYYDSDCRAAMRLLPRQLSLATGTELISQTPM